MKKTIITIAALITALTFSSCATKTEIPTDYTAAQIIQMGQNAFDQSDYKTAEACYETALKRYGIDILVYLEAKYELGHVYLQEKKWSEAESIFQEIIDTYESSLAGDLPGAYKKLAQIGLSQIPEIKKTQD